MRSTAAVIPVLHPGVGQEFEHEVGRSYTPVSHTQFPPYATRTRHMTGMPL